MTSILPGWAKLLLNTGTTLAIVFGLASSAIAAAADGERIKGQRFVTMAKNNTFSGELRTGIRFNIHFRQGGFVVFYAADKQEDFGRWRIDGRNRVCITWQIFKPEKTECYEIYRSGNRVTWQGTDARYETRVRGTITDTFLKPRSR